MSDLPVGMPQAKRQILSKGADGLTLATQPASTTVYSLKLDTLRKWWMGCPRIENRLVRSPSIVPRPGSTFNLAHRLVLSDLHCLHSPHSPVKRGITWSPSLTSVTPSPTLSTTLHSPSSNNTHHSLLINTSCKLIINHSNISNKDLYHLEQLNHDS